MISKLHRRFFASIKSSGEFAHQNLRFVTGCGKRRLVNVLILAVLQAFAQLANVVSIAPVMGIASNTQIVRDWIDDISFLAFLKNASDFGLLLMAVGVLLVVAFISTLVNVLAERSRARFAFGFSFELRRRIMMRLQSRPFSYFVQHNPSVVITLLQQYTEMYVSNVLLQLLELSTRILIVVLLSGLILWTNWQIALITGGFLAATYFAIFAGLAPIRSQFRERMLASGGATMQQATQYIQGIRAIRLQNAEEYFRAEYLENCRSRAQVMARQVTIIAAPKYAMELALFVAFSAIVLWTARDPDAFARFLPSLALIGLATYRLMPSLQQIYFCSSQISSNAYTLNELTNELGESLDMNAVYTGKVAPLEFEHEIRLENLRFGYPFALRDTLNGIDMMIRRGECVGICGSSGAGKSTLVDVLLGLQQPTAGQVVIDETELSPANIRSWRAAVGYVPQEIFLIDDTIASNIALGQSSEQFDLAQVERAARLAQIHEFIVGLPEGYSTRVGDRGARLSGGQRQRIALARALYHQPSILFLDEATSALDSETEEALIEAIDSLHGSLTIIMIAHRLSTLKHCDAIYELQNGRASPWVGALPKTNVEQ